MCGLEKYVGCTIKRELTNITIKISQPDLINKMTQVFNKDIKSLVIFNIPDTPYKGNVHNQ